MIMINFIIFKPHFYNLNLFNKFFINNYKKFSFIIFNSIKKEWKERIEKIILKRKKLINNKLKTKISKMEKSIL